MRIAIIGNQGFSMLNFRGALIEELASRGHVVYALVPKLDHKTSVAIHRFGAEPVEIQLDRTGTNPIADFATVLYLRRVFAELKPDIVLGYAAKPSIYGTLAAWLARVPSRFAMIEGLGYIFIGQAGEGLAKKALRKLVVELFRVALRRADKVFFLNPDDISDFTALGIVEPHQPINIGGIGVDLNIWKPAAPVLNPITFIFIGRLLRDKGVLDFVRAARQVKYAHPATRFLLVGGIDENPESISRTDVESWVSEGLVEWPGHVPVQNWLAQSSVFVLPSYREGVPRSTQEAMAMCRPVITTDVPGCRETVIHGENGFLVPPRDPQALAAAMQKFIDSPHRIVEMGTRSRELAEQKYDVRKVNSVMIEAMKL